MMTDQFRAEGVAAEDKQESSCVNCPIQCSRSTFGNEGSPFFPSLTVGPLRTQNESEHLSPISSGSALG